MSMAKRGAELGEETDTQAKLMEAAVDLFSTKGFSGTSIRDIARAMGMSISNIYHYYGSKDGILLAVLRRSSETLLATLREVAGTEMDPLERFRLLVRTHIRMVGLLRRENRIYMIERDQLSEEAREISTRIQREVLDIYLQQLALLKERGLTRAGHLTVLALNILGVINWLLRWYREHGNLSLEQVGEELELFIFYGVLGAPERSAEGA